MLGGLNLTIPPFLSIAPLSYIVYPPKITPLSYIISTLFFHAVMLFKFTTKLSNEFIWFHRTDRLYYKIWTLFFKANM